ncbi:MAG: sigma-54-dependent Fis family transcriptional regulator [Leptonema illini]|jgi:DNA-binding NtrC family response regulator|uniref:Two component, sigma54 specific, transcriptional regulator, Fis family n=2 Tax=Leptonema illini TaxID=183 RepID=H2CCF0_9LEPT|nr:sigma-54 dependent transcriptional regulator [Leptonema illini]EHQ06407.1 two component, sigma54 specific, transcriptional regulator, Fis family [Leptonema illini DSM 21528]KAB2934727.1 MAG: sigma-54-dependent Fis family transcriptional regulator [Leptonema illini]PKL32253.1 MAG: sigma-54-dependent Fis family transcriptional regulator [Spirochaetae bacterium HGW-Spirochaetae-10]
MKVYVIDDDRSIRTSLKEILEDEDFVVEQFATGKSAVKALEKERPALILLDLWLGKEDGLEVLDEIRRMYPALPVLMISGHGTIEQAVAATKKGAVDFLEKPLSIQSILDKIHAVLHVEPNVAKKKEVQLDFDEIIGDSEQILRVKQAIAQAARTNARVFIFGENGTGKELVARAIFRNSSRSDKPFVDLNCAAIPAELIESELFGHEKGAFTGAADRRIGKFEQADEGTLFLDEICDMAMTMQAKVLRVLEEQRFQRVGGNESISVDVRVIAATNIDPQQAIRDGRFREDLYYRLNVIPINMPALRERMGDIPLLLDHFLRQAVKANGLPAKVFTPGAIDLLARYEWPGNVRELKNVVERLAILSEGEQIDVNQVADSLFRPDQDDQFPGLDLRSARRDFEKKYIMQALKQFEKNISRTARFLGMERTHLHRKLKTLKINLDEL